MSEFSTTADHRAKALLDYMTGTLAGKPGGPLVKKTRILDIDFIPQDILTLFDTLFDNNYTPEEMKLPSNKLFNLLHKRFDALEQEEIPAKSFLYYLQLDNLRLDTLLKKSRPLMLKINEPYTQKDIDALISLFNDIQKINYHYIIKETILFPLLEKKWEKHQCLKLMWSFHDDIRSAIKKALALLRKEAFDVKAFNALTGKLYFNIYTILYREEKVLFPQILQTIPEDELTQLLLESTKLSFSFIGQDEIELPRNTISHPKSSNSLVSLSTGQLSLEQLELLFKFLPVDMTYVDAQDEVRFFSDPPHRIFPRSAAIIGRKVQNCHPPESVNIVEKILAAFKDGSKEEASFWIKMGPRFVYIRYFAMRDEDGVYQGTLEVSQEISDIRGLEGERRLLDWD